MSGYQHEPFSESRQQWHRQPSSKSRLSIIGSRGSSGPRKTHVGSKRQPPQRLWYRRNQQLGKPVSPSRLIHVMPGAEVTDANPRGMGSTNERVITARMPCAVIALNRFKIIIHRTITVDILPLLGSIINTTTSHAAAVQVSNGEVNRCERAAWYYVLFEMWNLPEHRSGVICCVGNHRMKATHRHIQGHEIIWKWILPTRRGGESVVSIYRQYLLGSWHRRIISGLILSASCCYVLFAQSSLHKKVIRS